jgi:membrane-associated protein
MNFLGIDLEWALRSIGYAGLFAITFADSGLLIGLVLPGDSLLLAAGLLASQGFFDIALVIVVCFFGAVSGDSVGYAIGKRWGVHMFGSKTSRFLNQDRLEQVRAFYARHGGKTIVFARFIHFVRTIAPMLAGAARMHYPTFLVYNIVGGALWAAGVVLAGFYLGRVIPHIDRYIVFIILGIIFASLAPAAIRIYNMNVYKKSKVEQEK